MRAERFPGQFGSISLWRYTQNQENYPGWNLSVDRVGGVSLLMILSRLIQHGGYRTLAITPPSLDVLRVPNNREGKAAWIAPTRWRIHYLSTEQHREIWNFPDTTEPNAELAVGQTYMAQLQRGVGEMLDGRGDYCIGAKGEGPRLWFWWRIS